MSGGYERTFSPFEFTDKRCLKRHRNPFLKTELSYAENGILVLLAKHEIVNAFWITQGVLYAAPSYKKGAHAVKKHIARLYGQGYLCRYEYDDNPEGLGGADLPVFYALTWEAYAVCRKGGYLLTYDPVPDEEAYDTAYVLRKAQLNQWHLGMMMSLERAGVSVRDHIGEYVYTKSGTQRIPSHIEASHKKGGFNLFLFPQDETDNAILFNFLLGVNSYAKKNGGLENPVILVLASNQLRMERAYKAVKSYPVLSGLPVYYAMDLYMPLCLEKPYEWLYDMDYMDKEDGSGEEFRIRLKRKSLLPPEYA